MKRLVILRKDLLVCLIAGITMACSPDVAPSTAPSDESDLESPPPEPPGMSVGAHRFWNAPGEDGWGDGGAGNSYVSSGYNGTPPDAPTVLQMAFPGGLLAGSSASNLVVSPDVSLRSGVVRPVEWYVRHVYELDPDWYGHLSVSKLFYFQMLERRRIAFFGHEGPGATSPIRPIIELGGQDWSRCGGSGPSRRLQPNAGDVTIPRGQWVTLEIYAKLNTYDPNGSETCDGVLRVWVNGQLSHDYSDIHWLDRAGANAFSQGQWGWSKFHYNPVWGGVTGSVPYDQYIWTAETYVSVK